MPSQQISPGKPDGLMSHLPTMLSLICDNRITHIIQNFRHFINCLEQGFL
jgi:hypothetical protein